MTRHKTGTREEWLAASTRETADAGAGRGNAAAGGAAGWLSLAAAPTFAIMALLTAVLDGGSPALLCSAGPNASPLSGMIPMYLLMSVFHSAPWLKLIPVAGCRHFFECVSISREDAAAVIRESM